MTDPAAMPEATETISFLRRFADLMSKGENAKYLNRAADLLAALTADLAAARDEESLWRYKHETAIQHSDALEAECSALKDDIDGHLNITTTILSERDNLIATLQQRETAFAELEAALRQVREAFANKAQAQEEAMGALRTAFNHERETALAERGASLQREREEFANKTQAQEEAMAALRTAFDQEREIALAGLDASLQRERSEFANKTQAQEEAMAALRIAFDQEREALKAAAEARGQELDQLKAADSEEKQSFTELRRERDELRARMASFDAKRTEIRSAFERISDLRNQTLGNGARAESGAGTVSPSTETGEQKPGLGEANAVVLRATLRQARAQFQYLARECVVRGDIASQVMCELGAYTMDLALTDRQEMADLPVGAVALNILGAPNPVNG